MAEQKRGLSLDQFAKPIGEVMTSVGTVYVHRANGTLLKRHRDLHQLAPEARARCTLPLVASMAPRTSFLAELSPLSDEALAAFNERDVAGIAEALRLGAQWVVTGGLDDAQMHLKQPRVDGRQVDETSWEFFDRIVEAYAQQDAKQTAIERARIEKLVRSPVSDLLAPLRERSASLGETVKAYEALPVQPPIEFHDHLGEMQRRMSHEREHDREVARSIANMTKASAELLKEIAEAADRFLMRFDARDIASDRQFKTQLKWAVGSLVLSAVLSIVGAGFAAASYYQDKSKNEAEATASKEQDEERARLMNLVVAQTKVLQDLQKRIDATDSGQPVGGVSRPKSRLVDRAP